jgi:hypothetical protein
MTTHTALKKIPSNCSELLGHLLDSRILRITRYSWYQSQEAAEEIKEMYDAPKSSVFRRTVGALSILLDSGLELGFSSIDSIASVTVWKVKPGDFEDDEDNELFPIDSCDQVYSEKDICQLIGKQVVKISILKRDYDNPLYVGLPCEVGLVLEFDNSSELILSHQISENIENFALVIRDEIDSKVADFLQEIQFIPNV